MGPVSTHAVRSRRLAAALALALAAPALIGGTGLTNNLDARLLAAHNRERAELGIAPLRWDPALVASAERWGGELAELGDIEHEADDPDDPDPDPEGENLWMGTRSAWAPEEMVGMWIAEKAHFVPGRFPEVSRTGSYEDVGHYTQLMWRDTGRVGCAVVSNSDDDILVCRYAQAGNVYGERPF
jgi:hypothetical protein